MKSKLWCWVVILIIAAIPAFAEQGVNAGSPAVQTGFASRHDLSRPLTDMVKMVKPPVPGAPREVPNKSVDLSKRARPAALNFDPLVKPVTQGIPMPAPLLSFAGPDADALATVVGFRVNPPDTNGDVGANHYISYVNLIWQVYDKTTGASVLGPFAGNSFWVGFGGICETTNDGDPIVLWDQFAQRWLVSQFAIDTGTQCVAVSATSDPTGAWHRYAFDVSAGMNDYPKFGVWTDGYYMSFNEFNPGFTGTVAVAFEKAPMLTGAAAQFVKIEVPAPDRTCNSATLDCYYAIQPAHIEGTIPPPAGTPEYYVMAFDDEVWGGSPVAGTDYYKVWKFAVDWAVPANSTWTGPASVATAEFNGNMCGFARACVAQPSPGEGLDAIAQFTMYRGAYRNFGDHDALYVSHTTNVGGNIGGVRWAELRGMATTPTVFQAGTQAPDGHSRWMGSIAADKDGNIAIGYSISSTTKMPSIGYAGRLASDPLGTLPQTEVEVVSGTGVQQSSGNRWGDYSSMSVDESDNCTFWYTQEYYSTSGSFDWDTHIASFKFPGCINGPQGTLTGTITSSGNGALLEGAQVTVGGIYSTTTNASGVYSINVPVGTYEVVASKYGYIGQTVADVVITDGGTTTQDFALVPAATVTVDGFVTAGAGAGWPLYADVTIESGGPAIELYTNPANGYYSAELLADTAYTITVEPEVAGYVPQTRAITTGLADQQENFVMLPAAGCTAPGFGFTNTVARADFEAGIPSNFTVTNVTTGCSGNPGWNTLNPGGHANLTGGTGKFAIADSDNCGSGVNMNTVMTTPTFDLTGYTGDLVIRFNSDYYNLCSTGSNKVSLDVYTGSVWTPLYQFCGTSRRGPRVESFTTTAANGAANAQVRWRYTAAWDWWWEVDNIVVSKGEPVCGVLAGGIIYGNVYDENTGLPLNGAKVTLDTGQTTFTSATPDDASIDDGFYMIFAPLQGNAPGIRTMTVEMPSYGTITRMVTPTPGSSLHEAFQLPAPMFSAQPLELRMRLPIGGNGTLPLTVNNAGGLEGTVDILELNAPAPPAPGGPFDTIVLPFDQLTKPGLLAAAARDARALTLAALPQVPVTPNAAGSYVGDYPTTLAGPWGDGVNLDAGDLWVGNPLAVGGDDNNYRFLSNGSITADTVATATAGGLWVGDMAYNSRTHSMWQVNVGGDNCISEFDPIGKVLTGRKICPAFGTSMRGLAYNALTDTYFAGSWNGTQVLEFTPAGVILRRVNVGLAVSGLAVNPSTGHVFVQINALNQLVYVLDANVPALPVVSAFQLVDSGGANAFGTYAGAGIEMDCQGRLWSINQTTKAIFVNDSGERGPCVTQIDWLTEDPTHLVVPAHGSAESTVTFNGVGQTPGCKEAQLILLNSSPYGSIAVQAGMTVAFNDVPLGAFGDAYIHAIAGAGISLGCGNGNFCPGDVMTRRTMAVWLLRGKLGSSYVPPPAVGIFGDVAPESYAADFIEDLYNRGITGGCSTLPLNYCPEAGVTRAQMAVFLLRSKLGSSYEPPACAGIFGDVNCTNFFAPWIEDLYNRGITAGCSADPLLYCPDATTVRSQMAIFTTRTFEIPLCKQ